MYPGGFMHKNLQKTIFYIMVISAFLSYISCASTTSENCQFEDLNEIKLPVINRVFADNEDAYLQFEKDFLANRQLALKNWLLSTKTFSDIHSVNDIIIEPVGTIGAQNSGVYRVKKQDNLEQGFILKIGTSLEEAPKLFRLQQSIVAKPECLVQSKIFSEKDDMAKALESFPKIIKIYEAANHSVKNENGLIKHLQLSLLEEASGQVLYSFHVEEAKAIEAYRALGKSLGYFHYLLALNPEEPFEKWNTWTQGDMHSFNAFYDPVLKNITFIDNEGMGPNHSIARSSDDLERSSFMFFNRSLNSGYSPIVPYLSTLLSEEAQRQGKLVANINYDVLLPGYIDPLSALVSALERPEIHTKLIESELFQEADKRFNNFSAFVQGYLDAMPVDKRTDVSTYFGNMCRKVFFEFMNNYRYNIQRPPSKRVVDAFRSIISEDFLDCIDHNHF